MKVGLIADQCSFISSILVKKLVELHENKEIEILVAIEANPNCQKSILTEIIKRSIIKFFNPSMKVYLYDVVRFKPYYYYLPSDIERIKPANINENQVCFYLKEAKVDVILSFGNPQIIRDPLLNYKIVNYHNSILPYYRGLNATAWSMYFAEKMTGFTFHFVNEEIDQGNIILQGSIPVDYEKTPYELEIKKTIAASNSIPKLIELLKSGYVGIEQPKQGSYFGRKHLDDVLTFQSYEVPMDKESIFEIKKLIKIFGGVKFKKNDKILYVTAINEDGSIKRIKHLPPIVYKSLNYTSGLINTLGKVIKKRFENYEQH